MTLIIPVWVPIMWTLMAALLVYSWFQFLRTPRDMAPQINVMPVLCFLMWMSLALTGWLAWSILSLGETEWLYGLKLANCNQTH